MGAEGVRTLGGSGLPTVVGLHWESVFTAEKVLRVSLRAADSASLWGSLLSVYEVAESRRASNSSSGLSSLEQSLEEAVQCCSHHSGGSNQLISERPSEMARVGAEEGRGIPAKWGVDPVKASVGSVSLGPKVGVVGRNEGV